MKKRLVLPLLVIAMILAGWVLEDAAGTIGGSQRAMENFLFRLEGGNIRTLKTADNGNYTAILYESPEGIRTCAMFERKLLSLRSLYRGMQRDARDDGLQLTGGWTEGGIRPSRCDAVVWGDNSDGEVTAYSLNYGVSGETAVTCTEVPAEYILHLYDLDGAPEFPGNLRLE